MKYIFHSPVNFGGGESLEITYDGSGDPMYFGDK
jgi:hypothetical protein